MVKAAILESYSPEQISAFGAIVAAIAAIASLIFSFLATSRASRAEEIARDANEIARERAPWTFVLASTLVSPPYFDLVNTSGRWAWKVHGSYIDLADIESDAPSGDVEVMFESGRSYNVPPGAAVRIAASPEPGTRKQVQLFWFWKEEAENSQDNAGIQQVWYSPRPIPPGHR